MCRSHDAGSRAENAHGRGITHRDLKPENIFVCESPDGTERVKVLDFGIAKVHQEQQALTKTGELLGTLGYMSPEQLLDPRITNPATDIYACGVVLYELLMGAPPFAGAPLQRGFAHTWEQPPRVDRADCPELIAELVAACLSKAPAARPTARAALDRLGASDLTTIDRSGISEVNVDTLSYGALAVVLATCVVAAAVAWNLADSPDDEPLPAPVARPAPSIVAAEHGETAAAESRSEVPMFAPRQTGCGVPHKPGWALLKVGGELTWRVRTPENYKPDQPTTAIILLPDDRQNAADFVKAARLADEADDNVLLVGPAAQALAWRPPYAYHGEITAAVDTLTTDYCVHEQRIGVLGFGTGGGPAVRMRCSRWAAAAAAISYSPDTDEVVGCDVPPRPTLAMLPLQTANVPRSGGSRCTPSPFSTSSAMSHSQYEDALAEDIDECGEPRRREVRDGFCERKGCVSELEVCSVRGGYNWPGHARVDLNGCDGEDSKFPANEVVWSFFQRHFKNATGCGSTDAPKLPPNVQIIKPVDYEASQRHAVVIGLGESAPDLSVVQEVANRSRVVFAIATGEPPSVDELLGAVCADRERLYGVDLGGRAAAVQELACRESLAGVALPSVSPPASCELVVKRLETDRVLESDDWANALEMFRN